MPKNYRRTRRPVMKKKKTKDEKQDRQIARLKRQVGDPEVKYTDTGITGGAGFNLTTSGTVICLNFNSQSLNAFGRVGNQIKNIAVNLRGYITLAPTELSDRLVRIQMFWDKAPTGANPTLYGSTSGGTAAVNDTNSTVGLIPNMFAPHSVEYRDRFKTIYDKTKVLKFDADAIITIMHFNIYRKLSRITRFDNPVSAVTSLATNGLFIAFTVDNVAVVAPACNFNSRVFFIDN